MAPEDRQRAKPRLSVAVTDGRGRPVSARGLGPWLAAVAPPRVRGRLSVALVSDATVRTLNRRYRRQDHATDVLSFPSQQSVPFRSSAETFLGDIVIARGVARRQAAAAAHGEHTELRVLALHGMLHLLGYDHHRDRGTMAGMERRLRKKGGLREGLIERARP
jgi:probable rRNA maturation factor